MQIIEPVGVLRFPLKTYISTCFFSSEKTLEELVSVRAKLFIFSICCTTLVHLVTVMVEEFFNNILSLL
jgi:hypothetical protein